MQLRTKGLLFVFVILASACATVLIGVLGGLSAKRAGDPFNMPSPYPELFYVGTAVTGLLLYIMYRFACRHQKIHRDASQP